jgi:peptide/nickel transport system permease protein
MLGLDYPAIMGITILLALIYVAVNLVVDLVIARLDPRVALS